MSANASESTGASLSATTASATSNVQRGLQKISKAIREHLRVVCAKKIGTLNPDLTEDVKVKAADYALIQVASHRSRGEMVHNLEMCLGEHSGPFVDWLLVVMRGCSLKTAEVKGDAIQADLQETARRLGGKPASDSSGVKQESSSEKKENISDDKKASDAIVHAAVAAKVAARTIEMKFDESSTREGRTKSKESRHRSGDSKDSRRKPLNRSRSQQRGSSPAYQRHSPRRRGRGGPRLRSKTPIETGARRRSLSHHSEEYRYRTTSARGRRSRSAARRGGGGTRDRTAEQLWCQSRRRSVEAERHSSVPRQSPSRKAAKPVHENDQTSSGQQSVKLSSIISKASSPERSPLSRSQRGYPAPPASLLRQCEDATRRSARKRGAPQTPPPPQYRRLSVRIRRSGSPPPIQPVRVETLTASRPTASGGARLWTRAVHQLGHSTSPKRRPTSSGTADAKPSATSDATEKVETDISPESISTDQSPSKRPAKRRSRLTKAGAAVAAAAAEAAAAEAATAVQPSPRKKHRSHRRVVLEAATSNRLANAAWPTVQPPDFTVPSDDEDDDEDDDADRDSVSEDELPRDFDIVEVDNEDSGLRDTSLSPPPADDALHGGEVAAPPDADSAAQVFLAARMEGSDEASAVDAADPPTSTTADASSDIIAIPDTKQEEARRQESAAASRARRILLRRPVLAPPVNHSTKPIRKAKAQGRLVKPRGNEAPPPKRDDVLFVDVVKTDEEEGAGKKVVLQPARVQPPEIVCTRSTVPITNHTALRESDVRITHTYNATQPPPPIKRPPVPFSGRHFSQAVPMQPRLQSGPSSGSSGGQLSPTDVLRVDDFLAGRVDQPMEVDESDPVAQYAAAMMVAQQQNGGIENFRQNARRDEFQRTTAAMAAAAAHSIRQSAAAMQAQSVSRAAFDAVRQGVMDGGFSGAGSGDSGGGVVAVIAPASAVTGVTNALNARQQPPHNRPATPTTAPMADVGEKLKHLCPWWPMCNRGHSCNNLHPKVTRPCAYARSCRSAPGNCAFAHPACVYGQSCRNRSSLAFPCRFDHQSPNCSEAELDELRRWLVRSPAPFAQSPAPSSSSRSLSSNASTAQIFTADWFSATDRAKLPPVCELWRRNLCANSKCVRMHKIASACRFYPSCRNSGTSRLVSGANSGASTCPYLHPQDVDRYTAPRRA